MWVIARDPGSVKPRICRSADWLLCWEPVVNVYNHFKTLLKSAVNQLGPYTLHERIACGGMGEIYLATLKRGAGFEKLLALKRILPHLAHDKSFVGMFEAEARLSALLNHRNIVHIYDFGNVEGESYIAMEFVDGFDLRALLDLGLETGRLLSTGLALRIAGDCARALDYAHRRAGADGEALQIIHRDISPQNVLLSMEGETKLTDFGLAKAIATDPGSLSGMLKGKLAYMPPEQIKGEALDSRADLFALGCVLYEMLSTLRVYPADLPVGALVAKVTSADYFSLDEVRPDIPAPIRAIVTRCLRASPAERFESAAQLERALRDVAADLGLSEPTYSLADYLQSFAEHRRVIATVQEDGTVVSRKPIVQRSDLDETKVETPMPLAQEVTAIPFARGAMTKGEEEQERELTRVAPDKASAPAVRWARPLALGLLLAALGTVAVIAFRPPPDPGTAPPPAAPKAPTAWPVALHPSPATMAPRRPRRPIAAVTAIPPRTTGTIELSGVAPGAACYAHNELRQTDSTIACAGVVALDPGPYRIVVTLAGHETFGASARIVAGAASSIAVTLRRSQTPCTVTVMTQPKGAAVTLDGERLAMTTPAVLRGLSPGAHTVSFTRSGHHGVAGAITCDAETKDSYSWKLTALKVAIQIGRFRKSLRPGSETNTTLKVGSHRVAFRAKAGMRETTVRVDAKPYVSVAVNGKSRGNTPTGFRIRPGRVYNVRLTRDGKSLKTVKVRADHTK